MERKPKQRGLALATSGLALAIGILVHLNAIRFVQVLPSEWLVLSAVCAVTIGGPWLLLHFGARLWKGWDPHFVLVPTLNVAILLSALMWAADEIRLLILVVWPVVLIFMAGYVGFRGAAVLSGIMTIGYLTAGTLADPPEKRHGVEGNLALVFFATNLFAGVVLGRIRHQRLALLDARAELARLVNTDPLTGIANRRHFTQAFHAEVARVERYGGDFSLAVLDLDEFKAYNDRLGHPAGDEALRQLGTLLQEQMRASDLVARLGGEEFAVLMVGTDKRSARVVAERLRRAVAEHRFAGERLTVSIGIASAPADGTNSETLLRLADRALYAGKAGGRNRVELAQHPQEAAVG